MFIPKIKNLFEKKMSTITKEKIYTLTVYTLIEILVKNDLQKMSSWHL